MYAVYAGYQHYLFSLYFLLLRQNTLVPSFSKTSRSKLAHGGVSKNMHVFICFLSVLCVLDPYCPLHGLVWQNLLNDGCPLNATFTSVTQWILRKLLDKFITL